MYLKNQSELHVYMDIKQLYVQRMNIATEGSPNPGLSPTRYSYFT